MNDVEILAKWMHDTMNEKSKHQVDSDGEPFKQKPLEELSVNRRERYFLVAAEMLANPPQVLVDAILAKPVYVERS